MWLCEEAENQGKGMGWAGKSQISERMELHLFSFSD